MAEIVTDELGDREIQVEFARVLRYIEKSFAISLD